MLRFRGINSINMDKKGRIAIPKKYRDSISDVSDNKLIVTIDIDSACLLIYTLNDWEIIEKKLASLPNVDSKVRAYQRLLLGHADEMEVDAQGRVLLPPLLRDHANLEKSLVLLGQGNKFELWSQELWDKSRLEMLEQVSAGDTPEVLASLAF